MLLCLPSASGASGCSQVLSALEEFVECLVEPVGRHYEVHFSGGHGAIESDDEDDDDDAAAVGESEEELAYLRGLDPKDWKNQDHYHVLGLQERRYKATDREIKAAFRRKVLRHHPDKRTAAGEKVDNLESDYFSCITRAHDLLSNPKLRRAFDSVDPKYDDTVPAVNDRNKADFFAVFGPSFEANARWSVKPHAPPLGTTDATEDEVNEFYNFWYAFESWREYSYLDEEDKEKGENRDERRWIDRENRAARQKRKKEEMLRIRKLVDNAMECDPRIRAFKEAAKNKKDEAKRKKHEEARAKKLAEEKERRDREEAERVEREQKERAEQETREREKKAREALKKEHKKHKKRFEALCAEASNFADSGSPQLVRNLEAIDQIGRVLALEELQKINEQMEATAADSDDRRQAFQQAVARLEEQLHREKMETLQGSLKSTTINGGGTSGASSGGAQSSAAAKDWSPEEIQLLVKAVNLFPAGTADRWEVVAQYIAQHSDRGVTRTAKDVLGKAKNMQKSGLGGKQDGGSCTANLKPAQTGEETIAGVDQEKISSFSEVARAWTNDEQKLLEQALKTYPVSLGPERWDRISQVLPNRTKKECMKRYKELVETVKAKKAAMAAAAGTKAK